eukprot:TRINITY_DN1836_c1_g2_i1.p1 TRINITY_DN1836_c1_g2~~TRINITY_DN1836_c1_g2_i1.p1  ORF type:complete len:476 (+),score=107.02 TRINITY_DN1836_c1_g2_i1:57-1484(+)
MPVRFACHGGDLPLRQSLRRITDAKAAEISPEHLAPIIRASHEADERRYIMKHLRECLSEPSGKHWFRIYSGMLLVEKLLENGSHALVVELAHGHHCDLIQKLSLLDYFDSSVRGVSNPWAQNMVRSKAGELRAALIPKLQAASLEELPHDSCLNLKDTLSCGSPGGTSNYSRSTATGSSAACSSSNGGGSSAASSGSPELGTPPTACLAGPPPLGRRKQMRAGRPPSFQPLATPEALAALSPRSRLQCELERITDSGFVDMPPELFTFVVRAADEPESLGTIVSHLCGCFADASKQRWRRIFAGLCLVEQLMGRGSTRPFVDAARSFGLDLVQQLWLLQEFEYRPDWRAQSLVRKKARALHDKLSQRLLHPESEEESCRGALGDAFGSLRSWVESNELSAPSDSSRPSSDSSEGDSSEEFGETQKRSCSRADCESTTAVEPAGGSALGRSADVFFTPMETPAQALPKPTPLLSL